MDVYIHYLFICWGEGGRGMEKKEKQKNKNRKRHLREHGLVLFGGEKTPKSERNWGVVKMTSVTLGE